MRLSRLSWFFATFPCPRIVLVLPSYEMLQMTRCVENLPMPNNSPKYLDDEVVFNSAGITATYIYFNITKIPTVITCGLFNSFYQSLELPWLDGEWLFSIVLPEVLEAVNNEWDTSLSYIQSKSPICASWKCGHTEPSIRGEPLQMSDRHAHAALTKRPSSKIVVGAANIQKPDFETQWHSSTGVCTGWQMLHAAWVQDNSVVPLG